MQRCVRWLERPQNRNSNARSGRMSAASSKNVPLAGDRRGVANLDRAIRSRRHGADDEAHDAIVHLAIAWPPRASSTWSRSERLQSSSRCERTVSALRRGVEIVDVRRRHLVRATLLPATC
jgi:hypothetical protein